MELVVLASGRGSNLQAIIDAIGSGWLSVQIKGVISDNQEAYALTRAQKAQIPIFVVRGEDYKTKDEFNQELLRLLLELQPELICLAGYMRLLPKEIIRAFPQRIMNIHPSLLPAFPGLRAQQQAFEYGVRIAGCTVHFVDEGMDTGPIILQEAVPVGQNEDLEQLINRILKKEHELYPRAIQLFSQGHLHLQGRRVLIKED
jgi:phosphoribosylglycinamide formyltransferase-1